jgi:hypothetical protein
MQLARCRVDMGPLDGEGEVDEICDAVRSQRHLLGLNFSQEEDSDFGVFNDGYLKCVTLAQASCMSHVRSNYDDDDH